MSLKNWCDNGWLRTHQSTRAQIGELLAIVDRDLSDAQTERLSDDWQFGIAYNAALKLCTILLHAEGYRAVAGLAYYRTLQALPLILGEKYVDDAHYLEACRAKRNTAEYDSAGHISPEEAKELVAFAAELRDPVLHWLKEKHPGLV